MKPAAICAEWRPGADVWEFLRDSLDNPISALLVSAERSLAAEFPPRAMSGEVLRAIGSGERTFTSIARAVGGIAHTTLTRATDVLTEKRVVAAELPLSMRPSKERRYRVADPYLRFWLAFLDPHMAEVERMRGDLTLSRIEATCGDAPPRPVVSVALPPAGGAEGPFPSGCGGAEYRGSV